MNINIIKGSQEKQMGKKRIIPCLDINNGRVVKGVNFVDLKDAGDPVEIAKAYNKAGADELVFLDITATSEAREIKYDLIERVSKELTIPFIVGGGIRTIEDFEILFKAGADKVSVGSAAISNPMLISEASKRFGSQRVIIAIDAKKREDGSGWNVYTKGGREDTGLDVIDWAIRVSELGAGEILVTSMEADGTKQGYDIDLTKTISENTNIPVIASGGAGKLEHFYDALTIGKADAVLAASLFHFKEIEIMDLKRYLDDKGIDVIL